MATSQRVELVVSLFERYYDRVYRFARRSVDAESAEDIAQEVFAKLLNATALEKKVIGSSYLIKIADNLIKRRYRQTQRHEEALAAKSEGERDADWRRAAGLGMMERDEERRACFAGYDALGPREQDALRLIVAGGMSYQAAAESLGVKVTAVNNWKYRGIQRLKQQTSDPDQPEAECASASTGRVDAERPAPRRGSRRSQRAG